VGVLNFKFPDGEYPADKFVHEIKLKDVEVMLSVEKWPMEPSR